MKICIGIPSPQTVNPEFALKNLPEINAYTKNAVPGIELFQMYKTGVMTSSNRNSILFHCLKEGIDGILWLDTDMLYPANILELYLKSKKDIIGTIYCKRGPPYDPCVYLKGPNKIKPYQVLDVTKLPKNHIIEVDGLGFGGLYVSTSVYKAMGKDKWMRYGRNFGIPDAMEDQESHDLIFCKTAQKYGFKIWVHTGVQSVHIGEKMVEVKDWERSISVNPRKSRIAVVMPSINIEKAQKTVEQIQNRAGVNAEYFIVEDKMRSGFMATMNAFVQDKDFDYYVYLAEDAYAGKYWLKNALDTIIDKDAGLLAFNDGKWNGTLAAFGMVEKNWLKSNYNGDLFYKGYNSHYGDTELTLLAKKDNKLCYNPDAVLVEVDYNKHGVNEKDKELFNKRKTILFNSSLQDIFS